jgi:hypothetical protein
MLKAIKNYSTNQAKKKKLQKAKKAKNYSIQQ